MEYILNLQTFILRSHPSLLPLFVLGLSFMQSWHCATMCGPLIWGKSKQEFNLYLEGRILSYTLAGGIAGFIGQSLKERIDIQIFNFLSFFMFFILSVFLILIWFFRDFFNSHLKPNYKLTKILPAQLKIPSFLQGVLSVSIPCPLIFQMLGFALAANTLIGGLIIGLGHSVITTPALWKSSQWVGKLKQRATKYQYVLRAVILIFLFIQLMFYLSKFLGSEESRLNKFLFCF